MATLIILNQISVDRAYLNGGVTVTANGSYTATTTTIFPLSRDSQLLSDVINNLVFLSDGVNTYMGVNAENYLNIIATSIGGQVVGYIGAPIPSFCILVGTQDGSGNTQPGKMSSNSELFVGGGIASGASDSGNPIKAGSVYNSTQPTPSTGQRVDLQSNAYGDLSVSGRFKYRNLTGNATTTVKSGAGILRQVMINNNQTGGSVVIYDNTAGSGTKIGTFLVGNSASGLSGASSPGPYSTGSVDAEFSTGLTVVTSGSSSNDITIIYK